MFSITQSQYLQYIRIAIQWGAATLGYNAFLEGSIGQFAMAAVLSLATLLWTAYATRLAAKINDLVGAEIITPKVAEKLKDVAADPEKVVSEVKTIPAPVNPAS